MRIDSHHHALELHVRPQPWTDELPWLRRSFAMDEPRPFLRQHAIDATIVVQPVAVAEETLEL